MQTLRKSSERGQADHGWLKSQHTFSFADYSDERFMGFHALRVINEDRIAPSSGFGMHPHRNMEITTYVVSGTVRHEDNLGHREDISSGNIQIMSAASGIWHSEVNPSNDTPLHLLQIWIVPKEPGGSPRYKTQRIDTNVSAGTLPLIASPDGRLNSAIIKQDAFIYAKKSPSPEEFRLTLDPNRAMWIQLITGELRVNDTTLVAGDALALENESLVHMKSHGASELIVFDLPAT